MKKFSIFLILMLMLSVVTGCMLGDEGAATTAGQTETAPISPDVTLAPESTDDTDTTETSGTTSVPEDTTATHSHAFGDWTESKAPTCTVAGEKIRTCVCGEKETAPVAALDHTEVIDKAVAPTCTQTGLTEGKHCSVCNAVIAEQLTLPVIDHNYENGKCTMCGMAGSQGIQYSLNSDGKSYSVSGIGTCTDSTLIIPQTYRELPVTSISEFAFCDCLCLTSLSIPSSVKNIYKGAFANCLNLTDITISNGLTSIGEYAFSGCTNLVSVELPDSITIIDDGAFVSCWNLTNITLPNGLMSVGNSAFNGCKNLNSVTFSDSITTIEDFSFANCTSLTYINFPAGVTNIAVDTLLNCVDLRVVSVYNKNCNIEDYYFTLGMPQTTIICGYAGSTVEAYANKYGYKFNCITDSGCRHTDISIVRGEDSICAVPGLTDEIKCLICNTVLLEQTIVPGLEHIYYDGKCTACGIAETESLIFTLNSDGKSYSVTGIGTVTDAELIIPATHFGLPVTRIGEWAFETVDRINSVTIPEGVTDIGANAFSRCNNLTTVTISEGVESIGNEAFSGCEKLTDISIPNSIISLGESIVNYCTNLKYNEYDNAYYIGNDENPYILLVKSKSSSISSCKINEVTRFINCRAFHRCGNLTSISIPSGVTEIQSEAFDVCQKLSKVTIAEGVLYIGHGAFSSCNIKSITIPDSVISVASWAFSGCANLKEIKFSNRMTSISDHMFNNCSGLESIIIPDNITSIGIEAFEYCTNLNKVVIPAGVTSIGKTPFQSCKSLTTIEVASGNSAYCSIDNCLIEIETKTLIAAGKIKSLPKDGSVAIIGEYAFSGNKHNTDLVLPEGIISIKLGAFQNSALTKITLPDSLESIGENAFTGCRSLKSITIPAGVASIGPAIFHDCRSLSSIKVKSGNSSYHSSGNCLIETKTKTLIAVCYTSVIPDDGSVTIIGKYAFDNQLGLTKIVIPAGVTDIGDYAFYGCDTLTSITIPNSVTSIGDSAFRYCTSLVDVYYAGTKEEWNQIIIELGNEDLKNATIHYKS